MPDPRPRTPAQPTPADRLVKRTSRSLALITLGLIAALLAGVGVVTAAVAINTTEAAIDRTLEQAAAVRLAALQEQAARQPPASIEPVESREPDDSDEPDDTDEPDDDDDNSGSSSGNSGPGSGRDDDDDETPRPRRSPTPDPTVAPTPSPSPSPTFGLPELDDRVPESADTFFLLLEPTGNVISNPQAISLAGLPNRDAAVSAAINGKDWRTVILAGDRRVRLLTQRVLDGNGDLAGTLQSGFELRLQDEQTNQILTTILIASLLGLAGAALVTLLVSGRALGPIRAAFAAERRFVASASHELRTPVAVMRASAEILQREDLVKPEGRKLVEDIIGESDRLARLVSDLLALASADAGAISVQPRPLEVRSFVADLARRAEAIAAERGVRVEVVQEGAAQPRDAELVVNADPDRMAQLLLIFIDNAIDHSPAGGTVHLVVGPVNENGRQRVAVSVADQGAGVPPEERARIFEPFARLTGRRRETGNTGLGLAIARILAARHEATLHVDDAPGGGAVFSVWLPRRPRGESRATG